MKGAPGDRTPGRYGEKDDVVSSRQPPVNAEAPPAPRRQVDEQEAERAAAVDKNQNNSSDIEGGPNDDGATATATTTVATTTTTSHPVDDHRDEASIALQVDAYVVGEPQARQRVAAPKPAIEATVIQNETQVEARRRRYFWLLIVVMSLLALSLCIALPLATKGDNGGDGLETPSPTIAPVLKDPLLILQPLIGSEMKDGSYEQTAYQWLTEEDESGILDDPETPEWRIVQRFVLANFYFATKGRKWLNQLRFLSKHDECTWNEAIPYYELFEGTINGYVTITLPAGVIKCDPEGRVQSLRIAQNGLQGTIPSVLRHLSDLKELVLAQAFYDSDVRFDPSPMPSWLAELTGLEVLDLTDCSLSGTIPNEIGMLTNLQHLLLTYNSITGTVPVSVRSLSELRALSIGYNSLTGTLPSELGDFLNLEFIELGGNLLTGTLPNSWHQLTNLEYVSLFVNQLSGTLPDSWSEWSNVEYVVLGQNILTGTLPDSWSQWSALSELSMESNLLTGTLPNVWSQLTNLNGVWLFDNYLTGTLPESYASWKNITVADFSANCLEGEIPLEYELEWTSLRTDDFSDVFGIQREDCQVGNQTST